MEKINDTPKYILYVRKSSEEDDKQVLSIESQTAELKTLAKKLNLKIIKTISESKSAKEIGRAGFNEMIELIKDHKVNGILCWKMDRLSRNPLDSGTIQWLLQRGDIKSIQTFDKQYLPEDNVLLSSIEFGMANEYIKQLSVNVKRGLKTKAEKGWYPGVAKPGYLNDKHCDKGEKIIYNDPNGFSLIKLAFEKLLTGLYRPMQVLEMLNNEWGYRTPQRKKTGGRPMAASTFYTILSDPFYYGEYEYPTGSDNWYKGLHTPMITQAQFIQIQKRLGKKDNPRPRISHSPDAAFYGIFRCADCGSIITPDQKTQTICTKCRLKFSSKHKKECPKCGIPISEMENPKKLEYIYYGCANTRKTKCNQISIEAKELDRQVIKILGGIKISENMKNWYIDQLNSVNQQEEISRANMIKSLQGNYNRLQKSLDNLLSLRISADNTKGELITDEEFRIKRTKINEEIIYVKEKIDDFEDGVGKWTKKVIDTFNFACYAQYNYENGSLEDKKAILLGLGSNLLIKDKRLVLFLPKHLELIEKANSDIKEIGIKSEPKILGSDNKKTGFSEPVFSVMLPGSDSNRRPTR